MHFLFYLVYFHIFVMRTTHISTTSDIKRRENIHLFEDINTLEHKSTAIEMKEKRVLPLIQ
jgi:hypothetical protein